MFIRILFLLIYVRYRFFHCVERSKKEILKLYYESVHRAIKKNENLGRDINIYLKSR